MKVYTALTVLFLLSEGWPGVVFGIPVYTVTEGENVTAECLFSFSGSKKTFCKDYDCKNENILVETTENTATNGSYTIRYEENKMYVNIKKVQLSDSGHYWCKLEKEFNYGSAQEKIHFILAVVSSTQSPDPSLNPEWRISFRPETDQQSTQGSVFVPLIAAGIVTLISVALIMLYFYCKKKKINRS